VIAAQVAILAVFGEVEVREYLGKARAGDVAPFFLPESRPQDSLAGEKALPAADDSAVLILDNRFNEAVMEELTVLIGIDESGARHVRNMPRVHDLFLGMLEKQPPPAPIQ
jgi:hypothetical protein